MSAVRQPFWRWLLLIWMAIAAGAIALSSDAIAEFRFGDPDDLMRLVEVRDWMAGQSWFDVSQHRMNPPWGLAMHWSRLVDLPLAAIIAVARIFTTQRMAETIAAIAVPMVTLGCVMTLVALLTRRWASPRLALLAAAACPASVAAWFALRPMRIDHHGWQLVAGLAVALAMTGAPTRWNAAMAGLCAAVWTHISLEGLPFCAAAGTWLGLRAMLGPRDEADRLSAYLASFTIGAATLLLAVKGPGAFAGLRCDAISTVHLAVLGWATLTSLAGAHAPRRFRIAIFMLGLGIDAFFYRLGASVCMSGPFGQLGPLGYRIWYSNVNEGLPLWRMPPELIFLWAFLPIVGLAGAVFAWARLPRENTAPALATYIVLLAAAIAVGAFVTRASAFANMLAMPGAMMALSAIVGRSDRASPAVRIVTLASALILCSPLGAALGPVLVEARRPAARSAGPPNPACGGTEDFAVLDRLPATTVLASISAGPTIIAATHHRAFTGPYHRDPQALEDLLRFFMSKPAAARGIALSRHATLVAFCPGDQEIAVMAAHAPGSLAASIEREGAPWLRRLHLPGRSPLVVYRIEGAAPPAPVSSG